MALQMIRKEMYIFFYVQIFAIVIWQFRVQETYASHIPWKGQREQQIVYHIHNRYPYPIHGTIQQQEQQQNFYNGGYHREQYQHQFSESQWPTQQNKVNQNTQMQYQTSYQAPTDQLPLNPFNNYPPTAKVPPGFSQTNQYETATFEPRIFENPYNKFHINPYSSADTHTGSMENHILPNVEQGSSGFNINPDNNYPPTTEVPAGLSQSNQYGTATLEPNIFENPNINFGTNPYSFTNIHTGSMENNIFPNVEKGSNGFNINPDLNSISIDPQIDITNLHKYMPNRTHPATEYNSDQNPYLRSHSNGFIDNTQTRRMHNSPSIGTPNPITTYAPNFSLKTHYNRFSGWDNQNSGTATIQNNNENTSNCLQTDPEIITSKFCSNNPGIHPHPLDCSMYLSCGSGRSFECHCPKGTDFNRDLQTCDHKYNVRCNQNTYRKGSPKVEPYKIVCPYDVWGAFPHPFSNRHYIKCSDGKLLIKSCRSGLLFSLSRNICDTKDYHHSFDTAIPLSQGIADMEREIKIESNAEAV
ncbi:putative uncharacterized protein DDB_G0279653 isoform X2 [Musca domestica]|uniref:Chitin-binding type-2 domain-containing protein n=1 Tax=Musca domestica TaxID=7370 RepID=A0ABM3VPT6_MUSDO|nr:putative uncharacterized protein DDB_G0279653 isoform X2 [Musca domestica]